MQHTLLVFLAIGGLFFSILSVLEKHVKWIISFCDIFGQGCRKALKFHLFGIPISWYGLIYYIILIFLVYVMEPWVFWFIMAGFGIELTLIWIMIYFRAFCIFCTINAVIMIALFLFVFDLAGIWESLSIILIFSMGSLFFIYRENVSEFKVVSETNDDSIVAKVNGDVITMEEVEHPLIQNIYSLKTKIYQLRKERLERLVRERLIKKQARLKGVSDKELIDLILKDKSNNFDDTLEQSKKEEIIKYADSLKPNYNIEVFLQPPVLPVINVPIIDNPYLGRRNAPVVVIEFSDYMCPACRKTHQIVEHIKKKYRDRIQWVFKDFPLEQHEGADKMAEAAYCANDQGTFWKYQDLLFSSENKPGPEEFKQYAQKLGLDEKKFMQCIENRKHRSRVEENVKIGREIGISATPTLIINGEMISGTMSAEKLEELIEEALKKVSPTITAGK
jgi:predicted DsbA family dithiol-disulfide isomerase/uncharacterized membrane protein